MSTTVYLNDNYSEKSIALFGNTKPYSSEIMKIGGKFNPSLKTSSDEDSARGPGWVFSKSKKNTVQELVSQINSGVIKPSETTSSKSKKSSSSSSAGSVGSIDTDNFITKQAFMALVSRVERLEQELRLIHQSTGKCSVESSGKKESVKEKQQIIFDEDDNDSENEEDRPIPRLLKSKK